MGASQPRRRTSSGVWTSEQELIDELTKTVRERHPTETKDFIDARVGEWLREDEDASSELLAAAWQGINEANQAGPVRSKPTG